ncbi:V-type proton ATPase subunit F-like isoform X1 [Solanum pennellii]|uniref:V-type proton ATPase subunit F-like isoform X1 n=1 Tax=Solanum pennellii TaxID=28526 RepID=A0ABM1V0P9_SOLPN|nr:V-type proton ATPase subunit F-like isoform X1 [Solanum pennellii]
MLNRVPVRTNNSAFIVMSADEDTITGFLLAGVGNVDLRRKTKYMIVNSNISVKQIGDAFIEFTTREDIAIPLISQYDLSMKSPLGHLGVDTNIIQVASNNGCRGKKIVPCVELLFCPKIHKHIEICFIMKFCRIDLKLWV